jgi:hypothetical protein
VTGPELLRLGVGRVVTRMGGCFVGSHAVFRGKDLHAELSDASWLDLYLFGITGRRFSGPQLRLLDAVWTYTSYPDPRLWNNRVAALAGSTRSSGSLALSAALAVSEAGIYGQTQCLRASDFLIRTRAALAGGAELGACVREELSRRRSLGGYGRPLASADERIPPILKLARSLGLADGPHLKLAFQIDELLAAGRMRMRINYAAVVSALAADLGLSPRESYFFLYPVFLAGMVPCFIEASQRPEGTLMALPCDGLRYRGAGARTWSQR